MSDDLKIKLLVVDDEQSIRRLCMTIGGSLGYACDEAESAEAAVTRAETDAPDLVLTDLKLPTQSGVDLLKRIKSLLPRTEVAIMTGHGSIESAVDAMKLGAYDYIEKPFRVEKMRLLLQRMAEKVRLVNENAFLREKVNTDENLDGIIGSSVGMQDVLRMISRLKDTRTPVLISGESGTGKELVARAIHFRGALAQSSFVAVDCGALVPTLMESELFGYEKGAFTGAVGSKPGKFEQADTGTVFLDEIGDVPAAIQVKLLRILQEREFERLGSNVTRHIDVRVVAATNQDLRAALEQGTFREDLYYRLNVVPMNIPPLRERKQDISFLANHFLRKLAPDSGHEVEGISDAAMEKLVGYHWPGNVRELENVIERALILCRGGQLEADDIKLETAHRSRPASDPNQHHFLPEGLTLDQYEQEIIREALRRADGNKSQAARLLGLTRNALRYRLTQMGLEA